MVCNFEGRQGMMAGLGPGVHTNINHPVEAALGAAQTVLLIILLNPHRPPSTTRKQAGA